MDDQTLNDTIQDLVNEEHRLWDREARGESAQEDQRRLAELQVTLDRCWDLLRQRRALRDAARNADDASPRDDGTVENYLQ